MYSTLHEIFNYSEEYPKNNMTRKFLIVEDDVSLRNSEEAILEELGKVLIADNEKDALKILNENKDIEAVLSSTDIKNPMDPPKIDGHRFMEKARVEVNYKGKIIHLTWEDKKSEHADYLLKQAYNNKDFLEIINKPISS